MYYVLTYLVPKRSLAICFKFRFMSMFRSAIEAIDFVSVND
jgi:hypothetical protein